MLASVGFLPLVILSFLNSPFSPGPIFFSSLSALWQTPHCSKTSLPLAASPLAEYITFEPTARVKQTASRRNRYIIGKFSRCKLNLFYTGPVRAKLPTGAHLGPQNHILH